MKIQYSTSCRGYVYAGYSWCCLLNGERQVDKGNAYMDSEWAYY